MRTTPRGAEMSAVSGTEKDLLKSCRKPRPPMA